MWSKLRGSLYDSELDKCTPNDLKLYQHYEANKKSQFDTLKKRIAPHQADIEGPSETIMSRLKTEGRVTVSQGQLAIGQLDKGFLYTAGCYPCYCVTVCNKDTKQSLLTHLDAECSEEDLFKYIKQVQGSSRPEDIVINIGGGG